MVLINQLMCNRRNDCDKLLLSILLSKKTITFLLITLRHAIPISVSGAYVPMIKKYR